MMKTFSNHGRWLIASFAVGSLMAPMASTPTFAAPTPGAKAPGGPGGPGMMRRSNAKRGLSMMWRGVGRLAEGTTITKAQAKKIVSLVRPWSTRATMSEAQAKTLTTQLAASLTAAQRAELQKRGGRRGDGGNRMGRGGPDRPGGMGNGPRGERGGERGPRGEGRGGDITPAQFAAMRAFNTTVNPFYAPTGYKQFASMPERMRESLSRRHRESRATLELLSRRAR